MKTRNYLSMMDDGSIKLHGFEKIGNILYVYVSLSKQTLVFESQTTTTDSCHLQFPLSDERTISDLTFIQLVLERHLLNHSYIYNDHLKNYLPTPIVVSA